MAGTIYTLEVRNGEVVVFKHYIGKLRFGCCYFSFAVDEFLTDPICDLRGTSEEKERNTYYKIITKEILYSMNEAIEIEDECPTTSKDEYYTHYRTECLETTRRLCQIINEKTKEYSEPEYKV